MNPPESWQDILTELVNAAWLTLEAIDSAPEY